ncbi:hypothetical protein EJ08DRAFT_654625 [Tothia fuscella]|uniref:HTH CENPB-type domain-containing protein n=1 Tax=Tothia fuscella TaxID=1048955 RepID=A0A9P4NEG6_9PEZI|nr:hypothetical protein EJ08DRAFT_654625 [Tothia fuscella]
MSRTVYYASRQLLSPQQESALVAYINTLTDRGTPPTNAMVSNFAKDIGSKEPGKNWCSSFVKRWLYVLKSCYLTGLDSDRKKADSIYQYTRSHAKSTSMKSYH